MRSFVIGGAGFIGSHLVDQLIIRGPVTVFDDLSTGKVENISKHLDSGRVTLVKADALFLEPLKQAMAGHDVVFHLAASTDIQFGGGDSARDLEQGVLVTHNVLESMRETGLARLVFSSSGTVYGNTPEPCREEDLGRLPISLYGASKFACEAFISAYSELYGIQAFVARFGNVVGSRLTHGVIYDLCRKLEKAPDCLEVRGDGQQMKPFLHVSDCVDGLLYLVEDIGFTEGIGVYNIAPKGSTTIDHIAQCCVGASPYPWTKLTYLGGVQGWKGDIPVSRLDPSKLSELGFCVRYTSDEAAERAILEIATDVFA